MALGYELDEDDTRDFEQDGLTGTVKRYATENMHYPCLIFDKISQYQLKVLKQMTSIKTTYDDEADSISLYVDMDGKLVTLGKIFANQVKSVLMLFEDVGVVGFYDANTELKGDYLYVLCN